MYKPIEHLVRLFQVHFSDFSPSNLIANWAKRLGSLCKEYWILTLCLSATAIIAFASWADRTVDSTHTQYWVQIFTGNFSAPSPDQQKLLSPWEYGCSVLLAVLINASPLIGVFVLVRRYLNALIATEKQEQAVKLKSLLSLVETLAKNELVNEFGQSDESFKKIGLAFQKVEAKSASYIEEVFGKGAAKEYELLLEKDLSLG